MATIYKMAPSLLCTFDRIIAPSFSKHWSDVPVGVDAQVTRGCGLPDGATSRCVTDHATVYGIEDAHSFRNGPSRRCSKVSTKGAREMFFFCLQISLR
jgi:hypothetical protein